MESLSSLHGQMILYWATKCDIYIYIRVCVCVCVRVSISF